MKALKSFAISFAAAALIIAIVAVFVTGNLKGLFEDIFNKKNDELSSILNSSASDKTVETSKDGESTNPLAGLAGESFSLLLVCTDYRPDVFDDYLPDADKIDTEDDTVGTLQNGFRVMGPSAICLIRCSKETGRFAVTPIPVNMNVHTAVGSTTLHDIYGLYGLEMFLAKIEAVTGITVDRYAVVNCDKISNVVNVIGSVFCNVPNEIFTDGRDYVSEGGKKLLTLEDPERTFDLFLEKCSDNIGPSSMGLLLYKDYSNGIDDELSISSDYAKGVLKNFAKQNPDTAVSMWKRIRGSMTATNVDADFITANFELIRAFGDDVIVNVTYPGIFKLSGDVDASLFEPNKSKAIDALAEYR